MIRQGHDKNNTTTTTSKTMTSEKPKKPKQTPQTGFRIHGCLCAMMTFWGIQFAPLFVPFQRRLQTLAVFQLCAVLFFGHVAAIFLFLYLLLHTRYYYLAIAYAIWFWFDRNSCHRGGRRRRFQWLAHLPIWKHFNDYFPITLTKTSELDPDKNYLFGYHPHGIGVMGMLGAFMPRTHDQDFRQLFPGILPTVSVANALFSCPFSREYFLFCGLCSASSTNIKHIFTRQGTGNAAVLALGGVPEIFEAHPRSAILNLESRKGFVKIALRHGVSLVPVFAFGENDLYNQVSNPSGSLLRRMQNKIVDVFGLPLTLFNGRGIFQYTFGILPHRRPIHIVVGKPLHLDKTENPSHELINKYHAEYVEHLQQLFDEYKVKFGDHFSDLVLKTY